MAAYLKALGGDARFQAADFVALRNRICNHLILGRNRNPGAIFQRGAIISGGS